MVVIANKDKVYDEFPLPLINRLEKHYISSTSLLTARQMGVREKLSKWICDFVKPAEGLR